MKLEVMDFVEDYKISFTLIFGLVIGYILFRRYMAGGVCVSKKRLDGKTVIITGCNTGIGLETTKEIAARGAKVIMACRDINKANKAATKVKTFSGNNDVHVEPLDLASLGSVRQFANRIIEKEKQLDILINNAGIMMCPKWKSKDGYEMQFAVNHLGHFLLTNLLLDLIKKSAPARIINVSSMKHYTGKIHFDDINLDQGYTPVKAYDQSKLANVLFTRELSERLKGTGVTTYSLHPGVIITQLMRHFHLSLWLFVQLGVAFLKTPLEGAQTTLHCALDEHIYNLSGTYFSDCAPKEPAQVALVSEDAKRLWKLSEEMVANAGK